MSWIPPDPAIRVRLLQADSGLPAITPLKEVSPVLSNLQRDLEPGDRFMARITQALPESNSYRALVGDKELTLLIPGSVKPNDMLELVVVEASPRMIRAQLATMGCPIAGDLKYGAPSALPDASIGLHSWRMEFVHPVRLEPLMLEATLPEKDWWRV